MEISVHSEDNCKVMDDPELKSKRQVSQARQDLCDLRP